MEPQHTPLFREKCRKVCIQEFISPFIAPCREPQSTRINVDDDSTMVAKTNASILHENGDPNGEHETTQQESTGSPLTSIDRATSASTFTTTNTQRSLNTASGDDVQSPEARRDENQDGGPSNNQDSPTGELDDGGVAQATMTHDENDNRQSTATTAPSGVVVPALPLSPTGSRKARAVEVSTKQFGLAWAGGKKGKALMRKVEDELHEWFCAQEAKVRLARERSFFVFFYSTYSKYMRPTHSF